MANIANVTKVAAGPDQWTSIPLNNFPLGTFIQGSAEDVANDPKCRNYRGVDWIRITRENSEPSLECFFLKHRRLGVVAVENGTNQPVEIELEGARLYISPGSLASASTTIRSSTLVKVNQIQFKNLDSPLPDISQDKDSVYAFTLGKKEWSVEINPQPYHHAAASPRRAVSFSLPCGAKTKLIKDLSVQENRNELNQILELMKKVEQAYLGFVDQNPWERFGETWRQKPDEISYREWLDVCQQLLYSAPPNIQRV